jgi:hypothetical protein
MKLYKLFTQFFARIWAKLFKPEQVQQTSCVVPPVTEQAALESLSIPEEVTAEDLRNAVELGKLVIHKRKLLEEELLEELAVEISSVIAQRAFTKASQKGTVEGEYSLKDLIDEKKAYYSGLSQDLYWLYQKSNRNIFGDKVTDLLKKLYNTFSHYYYSDYKLRIVVDDLIEKESAHD